MAIGSVIVIIVAESELFEDQWKEYIFFAGLVVGTSGIFKLMTLEYKMKDQYAALDGSDESPLLSNDGKSGLEG